MPDFSFCFKAFYEIFFTFLFLALFFSICLKKNIPCLLKDKGYFSLYTDIIIGFFIAFAMPTAGLASTFADRYDGDTENAVSFTLGTTLFSIATIPVLYWILLLVV